MEPITAVTAALSLTKSAGELSKKLYEFGKGLKDREQKRQVEEMLDTLTEFKREASQLEDQIRDLREKLRFKSDEYVFRTPFHYHKDRPNEALCAVCFAKNIAGHMGEPGVGVRMNYRLCLVCRNIVQIEKDSPRP